MYGGTTKAQTFQETFSYDDCKSNSSHKDKGYIKGMTFIHFNSVVQAKNPVHTLSFSCHLYPRQVHSHVTSDSNMCEVELGICANEFSTCCATVVKLNSCCCSFTKVYLSGLNKPLLKLVCV